MISQKCPKCLSSRVRRGYRPTPFWSKILFRYNLLCDNCNWEFTGFAVPGTVSAKPTKNPKKKTTHKSQISSGKSSNQPDSVLPPQSGEKNVSMESPAIDEADEKSLNKLPTQEAGSGINKTIGKSGI